MVTVIDLVDNRELKTFPTAQEGRHAKFSLDSSFLVVIDEDRNLTLAHVASGDIMGNFQLQREDKALIMKPDDAWTFSPDGRLLAYIPPRREQHSCVKLYDLATRETCTTLDDADAPLIFSPDSRKLLTRRASTGFECVLWDTATARSLNMFSHDLSAPPVFSPDSKLLATGRDWREIVLLETQHGMVEKRLIPLMRVLSHGAPGFSV